MRLICPAPVVVAGLIVALAVAGTAQDHEISLAPAAGWGAIPAWTPGSAALEHSHTEADGVATFRTRGGGRTMIWLRSSKPPLDFSKTRYVSMRYRVRDVEPELESYFLYSEAGVDRTLSGKKIAFRARDLVHDGQWHVTTTLAQEQGELRHLCVRFAATEGRDGLVEIAWLRFTAEPPRFPAPDETIWTLWNGRWQTVNGPVLKVKHIDGATYREVWNDHALTPAIEDGLATLQLSLGPRDVGVVSQKVSRP